MNVAFVVDESVDYAIVTTLKELQYNIIAIADNHKSLSDSQVLSLAFENNAVLITGTKTLES